MTTIDVVHATRRPQQALEMRDRWLKAAKNPERVTWVFGIDDDDDESLRVLAGEWTAERPNVSAAGGGCVRAYNETAALGNGAIVVCASDDVYPIQDWDSIIEDRIGDTSESKFLAVSDGRDHPQAIPMQVVTRAWIEKHGYIFHPRFKSMYGDFWMAETARREGSLIRCKDLVFEHKHPMLGTAEMDSVYAEENAKERYDEGEIALSELFEPLPISLCMIVGNEQIVDCLESAKGAFDELCLVLACGESECDATYPKAQDWCFKNGKKFRIGLYSNSLSGLPHVDDFAAARNLSFSLATNFWQLWLDADDRLDEINCRRIREASKRSEYEAYRFSYLLEPQGAVVLRERLIKRGHGRWTKPIHETCEIDGYICDCEQVVIRHLDPSHKIGKSAERNLAILERVLEHAPRNYFYAHSDLKHKGRTEEAIQAGRAALALLTDGQPEERYIVHLNLSELEPERRKEHLLEAVKIQPHRREAFAYLCQASMIDGRLSDAVSFFRMMTALPPPAPLPWTHQGHWYGWGCHLLRVRLLRMAGKTDLADAEHAEHMKEPDYAAGVAEQ